VNILSENDIWKNRESLVNIEFFEKALAFFSDVVYNNILLREKDSGKHKPEM